jgi:dihydrofolate synthase / folylpolyglutamate synthase
LSELTYAALMDHLFPRLTGGIRWGLDRTLALLDTVGDPHLRYRTIHVGGTNGKGSVAALLEAMLRRQGVRTGLYTSPHLVDFRERIQVRGRPVSEEELLAAAAPLWWRLQELGPSFFEAATVIGFEAMARAGVELAVVEVGMGGRLDATNVVRPEVVVITNVAMDHAQYLGPDLSSIAREKAGIIKPGVPAVTAVTRPEVLEVLAGRCAEVGAPLHVVPPPPAAVDAGGTAVELDTVWGRLGFRVPLAGRHQAANLAVAVRALELLGEDRPVAAEVVLEGAASVRWPGRLQVERRGAVTWIFDVAHNEAGVQSLVEALPDVSPPRPLVALVGVMGDKDWARMLPPLLTRAEEVLLCEPPSAPPERRWNPEAVLRSLGGPPSTRVLRPFPVAVAAAEAAARGGTVLCTGSVHTVGDVMLLLGVEPFPGAAGLQVSGGAA